MVWLLLLTVAQTAIQTSLPTPDIGADVEEAAQKTGVPAVVIWAVIKAESNGNPRAVSSKGGMGLMQLMPPTWQKLRNRYALGLDPFDPHDNIIAGTFYLRTLYDAYGADGFLAAYNAGPGRWEAYRDTGEPLPLETRSYVASIAEKLGSAVLNFAPPTMPKVMPSWTEAALFLPSQDSQAPSPSAFSSVASPFVSVAQPDTPTSQ